MRHTTSNLPSARQAAESAKLVVDPATVIRVLPATFFGINYSAFWDNAQGSAASARALAQTPIKTVRFPGGVVADWYDWQDPYYKGWSRTSPRSFWAYARSLGATHTVFGTNYQGNLPNPPGKSYAVNSPDNAAAWVAYDKRIGIRADMEVGNEEDMALLHKADDPAYQAYIVAFNQQAKAMHSIDPHIRVLGPAGVNEYYWWAMDGLGMFLHGTGNRYGSGQVDGVSLHFYKGSTWYDARSVAQYWLSPQGPWAAIEQLIRRYDTRNLPVYITEWNLGASDNNNAFTPTLGHALATADMLGAFAQSGVAGEDYWTTHYASGWGLLYGVGEKRPVDSPTPTYYAMALWSHMGKRVIALSQDVDPASVLSAYATTRGDGSVQVLAINKLSTPRTVHIVLNGASPNGHRLHVYSLSGVAGTVGDLDAVYDGIAMPSPQRPLPGPRDLGIVRGNSIAYTVPGNSAVVLDLAGTTSAARLSVPTVSTAPLPTATPIAPPHVIARGSVDHSALTGGQVQTLHAHIDSNSDLGPALIDLEVYDSANRKVFQTAPTMNLAAGSPIDITQPFTLPVGAAGGTYYYKVGVFSPNWSTTFAWTSAASFSVSGPPPVKVSVTGSVSGDVFHPGDTATFSAVVTAKDNSLSQALVDIEVYSFSGKKLCQPVSTNVSVPANSSTTITAHCTIPSSQPTGSYVMKIGVFTANWSTTYAWNNNAATFSIQ